MILLRDILPPDSPDPLVARTSEEEGAVLVSCDGDFRRIASKIPKGERTRFRKLSRIHLQCQGPQAIHRIKAAMSFIEAEYELAQKSNDPRMHLVISKGYLKTDR